jgi:shikimate dehydrogenase
MKHFGIIGFPLSHTFSPGYFTEKFDSLHIDADYKAFPIKKIELLPDLIEKERLSGINVTLPYKQQVIPFLDEIDDDALQIGAVNTITVKNGMTKGFNTDVLGFELSLMDLIQAPQFINGAFILGTGGAAKAVEYVLKKLNIKFTYVSRDANKGLTYDSIEKNDFFNINLIINTTPIGMYPKQEACPAIPYNWINENYFLYDLVYNPEKTLFLSEGLKRNAKVKNGYDMLILQAEKAWEIWNKP